MPRALKCPRCQATDWQCLGKRNSFYPALLVAVLGVQLALLHQLSSPVKYRCHVCGSDFTRRGFLARLAVAALFFFLALVSFLVP